MVNRRLVIGKKKQRPGSVISLASGRMLEMEQRLDVNPEWAVELADMLDKVRSPMDIAKAFGFMNHPQIVPLILNKSKKLVDTNWRDFVPIGTG